MAFAALVSSLALLAAQPALLLAQAEAPAADQAAPASDPAAPPADQAAPAETASAPLSTGENPDAAAQADALAKGEDPFPTGAPTDDYGLVGWCYGALAGHMGLYKSVMPEVERIERAFPDPAVSTDEALKDYADQHEIGAKDLDLFKSALDAADKAQSGDNGAARKASIMLGHEAWKGADSANKRTVAQLWMSWELPARCEVTAKRLMTASNGQ
jgi:hypothetical protein